MGFGAGTNPARVRRSVNTHIYIYYNHVSIESRCNIPVLIPTTPMIHADGAYRVRGAESNGMILDMLLFFGAPPLLRRAAAAASSSVPTFEFAHGGARAQGVLHLEHDRSANVRGASPFSRRGRRL